uniref:Ubiquitin-like protease family profile domain-containing protein n=1 Tax=Brassica oleracea var. oleracea TaxID=109376 RepID=A0A0D3ACI3_BRAOL
MQKRKIDKARRTLIVASSFGDREKRRFEVLQKGISPSPVSFWPGLCFFHCSQGTETQVEKVNNSCRTSILAKVAKYCPDEYTEVSEDPLFVQVVAIYVHKLQFSERAIHTFVCKQLLTAKRHELWFHYARRPLRFSMQEFYAITGFWSKLLRRQKNISVQQIRKVHVKLCNAWSRVDRLRLVYLCVIAGILMAKDEKVWIPHKYIKLVMDFEKMRKYLWGLHSFDMLIWLMEAVPDIGSLLGQKLRKGVTTMRFKNWKGSAKISYEDIITIESNFASTETVKPFQNSSEEDGSDEEADVETSDTEIEDEIESTRVSLTKKRKNRFRDTGAESRKKRLLCQRSTEKYRDLEEEMKSYIQSMFNSSFTALELEVREVIEDRFIKLEEKILSSQTQGGAPANTQTRGADPFWTPSAAIAPASVSARGPAPTPASTEAPASVSTSGLAPSRSEASAPYHNRASATVHTGGPANAAKTRSQTKDADLSDVFGSLFSTLDVNVGTQEHLQKTMGSLTQESNVDGFDPSQDKQSEGTSAFTTPMTSFRPEIFKTPFLIDSDDLEVRCKAKDYELVFLPEDKWAKLIEWTSIPHRVAFLNCMFSNQITTAYGKFDGNRRGYKIDDNFLEYGRGELPYNGSTGSVWSVDVDRLYIPICVNQIHWISIYVNLVNRTVDVFDCGGKKNNRVVETFTVLIPRIVKAVQSPERKKDFNVKQYTVSYVPMRGLNMNGNDCGAYSLKFIECHLLVLDFSLVNDENIKEA